jgi:2-polyprenyl-3-methyl-5-hydroxy-6-metoxy-1,4-benzoquinol methylase
MLKLKRNELIESEIFNAYWYYKMELLADTFTNGQGYDNIILTRKILKNIDVKGMNCLDIGAMEGLISILIERQGAQYIHAYERVDCGEKVKLVKTAYDVNFDYTYNLSLRDFLPIAKKTGRFPYDIIVFSGVLYHMFDPLAGLAMLRGLLRNGGILLLETAALIDNAMAMYFNAEGRFYPGTNYFMVSLACLDYILRFLRLKPLDCLYLNHHKDTKTAMQVCRVCIPCLAVENPLADKDDAWIKKPFIIDFRDYVDWDELKNDKPVVSYLTDNKTLIKRSDIGAINIFESVVYSPAVHRDKEKTYLRLNDSW